MRKTHFLRKKRGVVFGRMALTIFYTSGGMGRTRCYASGMPAPWNPAGWGMGLPVALPHSARPHVPFLQKTRGAIPGNYLPRCLCKKRGGALGRMGAPFFARSPRGWGTAHTHGRPAPSKPRKPTTIPLFWFSWEGYSGECAPLSCAGASSRSKVRSKVCKQVRISAAYGCVATNATC